MTEYATRRRRIVLELPGHKADALLVSGLPNIRYLSGFTGSNALLVLDHGGGAVLFTDPRYTLQSAQESDCTVRIERKSLYEGATKWIARKGLKRIAVERSRLTLGAYTELQEKLKLGASIRPTSGLVEKHRMIKSDAEIAAVRTSVETNGRAFMQAITSIRDGMTETDLAAELEYRMRRNGAERPSFETIVASGPRTALPHAQPSAERLRTLILIDMGCMQAGYASDMTRMLHLGKPGARARKLYKAVLEAQLAAISAVRAGVKAGSVDRAARSVLKAHGLDKDFVHSTGHGLGLEIHEPPRLGKRDSTYLQAGMLITIEPGAYIRGFGGVRIEDTVRVTESGCEILTHVTKELLVV